MIRYLVFLSAPSSSFSFCLYSFCLSLSFLLSHWILAMYFFFFEIVVVSVWGYASSIILSELHSAIRKACCITLNLVFRKKKYFTHQDKYLWRHQVNIFPHFFLVTSHKNTFLFYSPRRLEGTTFCLCVCLSPSSDNRYICWGLCFEAPWMSSQKAKFWISIKNIWKKGISHACLIATCSARKYY